MNLTAHKQQQERIDEQQTISPQMKTVIAVTDAWFGKAAKEKPITPRNQLAQCIESALQLKNKIMSVRDQYPDRRANLEESERFLKDALNNLIGQLRDVDAGYEFLDVHHPHCQCDDCAAARSDEHHDRKREN